MFVYDLKCFYSIFHFQILFQKSNRVKSKLFSGSKTNERQLSSGKDAWTNRTTKVSEKTSLSFNKNYHNLKFPTAALFTCFQFSYLVLSVSSRLFLFTCSQLAYRQTLCRVSFNVIFVISFDNETMTHSQSWRLFHQKSPENICDLAYNLLRSQKSCQKDFFCSIDCTS